MPNRLGTPRSERKGQTADLTVTCWCEAEFVRVSVEDVRAGRTRPCPRPDCKRISRAVTR